MQVRFTYYLNPQQVHHPQWSIRSGLKLVPHGVFDSQLGLITPGPADDGHVLDEVSGQLNRPLFQCFEVCG